MSGSTGVLRTGAAQKATIRLDLTSRSVLAASGFVMLAYVILHMAGNLLAFVGSATFDAYARALRELGSPFVGGGVLLMLARAVLASALVAHLAAHVRMLMRPPECPSATTYRPVPPGYVVYSFPIPHATGVVILLFVALHLAHLTFGATVPAFDPASAYGNLITALRSWPVALGYIAAAAAVGGHLLPGVWTGMSSLGLIRPRTEGLARILAPAIALAVSVGLASVPVGVLAGVLR